jgi:hypothetical protein
VGFQVLYLWNGSKRKFIPDFLVRYRSGKTLVLEIKVVDSDQGRAKRVALAQWVRAANAHGPPPARPRRQQTHARPPARGGQLKPCFTL